MDWVQLLQGWSHFEEAVYFLPLTPQNFLVLILSISEGRKVCHFTVADDTNLLYTNNCIKKLNTMLNED